MSTRNIVIAIFVVAVLGFFVYLIMKGNYASPSQPEKPNVTSLPSATAGSTSTSSTETQKTSIDIKNFSFNPSDVTVKAGSAVTWTNNDSTPHTITSDPDGSQFKSSPIQPGEMFQFTFNQAGTFAYHCSIHTSMKGSVVVTP